MGRPAKKFPDLGANNVHVGKLRLKELAKTLRKAGGFDDVVAELEHLQRSNAAALRHGGKVSAGALTLTGYSAQVVEGEAKVKRKKAKSA